MNAWRRYLCFWGTDTDADADDELRFHFEQRVADYMARGLSRPEAETTARERLGDMDRIAKQVKAHDRARARSIGRRDRMGRIMQDLRLALRGLRRAPGFAVTTVLILGLGIGMATAMASVVHAVLIRRLPVQDQDRIVTLSLRDQNDVDVALDSARMTTAASSAHLLTSVAGVVHWGAYDFGLRDGTRTLQVPQTWVTGNLFDVLGTRPLLGRLLRPTDNVRGATPVMVLSYQTWKDDFDGDPRVIGKHVRGVSWDFDYTIVGVAPPGLDYPAGAGAWTPIANYGSPACGQCDLVGRLARGATPGGAASELLALMKRSYQQRAVPITIRKAVVHRLSEQVLGDARPVLVALAVATGLLLLIACVNVGNLLLLRAASRTREVAVRRALGATVLDIARLRFAEAVVLAALGGALGFVIATASLHLLVTLAPAQLPRLDDVALSGTPAALGLAVTFVTVLLFGLGPSIVAARSSVAAALRFDLRSGLATTGHRRVRAALVASQVALAVIVLSGAGLLVRSLAQLERLDLGYAPDHLGFFALAVPTGKYKSTADYFAMADRAYARLRAVPGVTSLSPVIIPPFLGPNVWTWHFDVAGRSPDENARLPMTPVETGGAELFKTLGIPMRAGRAFTRADAAGAPPVVVVSESAARLYWPGENPIGKRLRLPNGGVMLSGGSSWRTVVGVVADTRFRALRDPAPTVYMPWRQSLTQGFVALRTRSTLASVLPSLRAAMHEVDPDVTVFHAKTMDDYLAGPLAEPRWSAFLMSAFALGALALAAIGLYGVMAYAVRERTREIGIRMALGATARDVRADVLRRAASITILGIAGGLVVALAGSRLLSALLFDVAPTDPWAIGGACAMLALIAAIAAYVPAWRATRIDPVQALRAE